MHNDFPLAPEKIKVSKEILPKYQLQMTEKNEFSLGKNEKLISSLGNKKIQTPLCKK